jgi:uncharacterized protein
VRLPSEIYFERRKSNRFTSERRRVVEDFTPLSGLVGGIMIGAAATLMLWLNGRISGISGITGGLLERRPGIGWRLAFLVGLVAGPPAYAYLTGPIDITMQASVPVLVLAGLLVGFGTRLGSGCTSGHGVCGIARLSRRSLAATVVFMCVAIVTVFVTHHVA